MVVATNNYVINGELDWSGAGIQIAGVGHLMHTSTVSKIQ